MSPIPFQVRLPEDLHAAATEEVERRKKINPGASLNGLMCEALAAYLAQLRKEEKQ